MPKYLLCKQFNISVNTYSKYLKECIDRGYIYEQNGYYRIIPFRQIIKDIFGDSLFFGRHSILKDQSTDIKQIKYQVEQLLVKDNIIDRQEHILENKRLKHIFLNIGTDSKARAAWFSLPYKRRRSLSRKFLKGGVRNNGEFVDSIITSARHTAKTLGCSHQKANSILNRSNVFSREIKVSWVRGISNIKYFQLQAEFPNATIIPCFKIDMIKVCHGSSLRVL